MATTYADSGVNIELGDDVSRILYNAAKQTWENRKGTLGELVVPFDDFSGIRAIDVSSLPSGTLMNIGFDGVGTKVEIAERVCDHRTIAYDLFAMVCDDAVVRGAEPVIMGSILDVNSLGKGKESYLKQIKQLAEGYIGAAKAANVAVVNGEVAELGSRVKGFGPFNYNWGASVVWFAKKERIFTGKEVKLGDAVVALREDGFRSNGISLVRKIMRDAHGENWHNEISISSRTLGELALKPSRIYCSAVADMFGGYSGEQKAELHGVVHVTGGGIPGKLGRVLKPSGLGAVLDDLFDCPEIMRYCMEKGKVSDREAYSTWNMGQGMLLITPDPKEVIRLASKHKIEAKIAGKISSEKSIRITKCENTKKESPLIFKL